MKNKKKIKTELSRNAALRYIKSEDPHEAEEEWCRNENELHEPLKVKVQRNKVTFVNESEMIKDFIKKPKKEKQKKETKKGIDHTNKACDTKGDHHERDDFTKKKEELVEYNPCVIEKDIPECELILTDQIEENREHNTNGCKMSIDTGDYHEKIMTPEEGINLPLVEIKKEVVDEVLAEDISKAQ